MSYPSAGRKRIRRFTVAAAAALMGCMLVASGAAARLQSLTIAYDPNPTNTSIVVAQQQGFFKKEGLNVKLTTSADTTALLPSVGKQFDLVGAGPSSILQFAAHGFHPVLVSAQTIENGGSLRNTYLLAAAGITSLQDLVGKTVGAAALSGTQYDALLYELKQNGISATSVKVLQVPFADMASDLKSGTIQAALAINPFAQSMLAAGDVDLGDPISYALKGKTAMSIGWVALNTWADEHPTVIKDFLKAQNLALKWMEANNAAAQQILINDFQLPAIAAAKYPITAYVSFTALPSYLTAWEGPLKAVGALRSSFNLPAKDLMLNSAG